jgi:hypothetical protein
MPDKLSQFSADMFGRCIQAMLWSNQIETFSPGEGWVENAVVGLFYRPEDEFAAAVVGEAATCLGGARIFQDPRSDRYATAADNL